MRSIPHRFRIRTLAALGGVLLLAAGCSSAGGATSAPSAAAPSSAASQATVAVANGSVGAYLTGADGKTLYTFKPDSANTSTCTGTCAQNWPPFTVGAGSTPAAGSGVTGKLSTFARPDGTMQVAYNGIPLYYYSGDAKAGDTTGQGAGSGKWSVASPTGAPSSAAPSSSAPSPSASGGSSY